MHAPKGAVKLDIAQFLGTLRKITWWSRGPAPVYTVPSYSFGHWPVSDLWGRARTNFFLINTLDL